MRSKKQRRSLCRYSIKLRRQLRLQKRSSRNKVAKGMSILAALVSSRNTDMYQQSAPPEVGRQMEDLFKKHFNPNCGRHVCSRRPRRRRRVHTWIWHASHLLSHETLCTKTCTASARDRGGRFACPLDLSALPSLRFSPDFHQELKISSVLQCRISLAAGLKSRSRDVSKEKD